tara:strand:- start:9016 stop:9468 length:453 start_codon:yes stop_codon:yes gene_type:complete
MTLRATLDSDLKEAMRNKDVIKRTVLRTVLSEIRNTEIAKQNTLDDSGIEVVITKQAQQRKDSIEAYITAERHDLVDKETQELNILSSYLPEQMSDDEVREIVKSVIRDLGAENISDMGKVMRAIMPKVQGRADGKVVNGMVTQILKSSE